MLYNFHLYKWHIHTHTHTIHRGEHSKLELTHSHISQANAHENVHDKISGWRRCEREKERVNCHNRQTTYTCAVAFSPMWLPVCHPNIRYECVEWEICLFSHNLFMTYVRECVCVCVTQANKNLGHFWFACDIQMLSFFSFCSVSLFSFLFFFISSTEIIFHICISVCSVLLAFTCFLLVMWLISFFAMRNSILFLFLSLLRLSLA